MTSPYGCIKRIVAISLTCFGNRAMRFPWACAAMRARVRRPASPRADRRLDGSTGLAAASGLAASGGLLLERQSSRHGTGEGAHVLEEAGTHWAERSVLERHDRHR